jgi:hypothetical protein
VHREDAAVVKHDIRQESLVTSEKGSDLAWFGQQHGGSSGEGAKRKIAAWLETGKSPNRGTGLVIPAQVLYFIRIRQSLLFPPVVAKKRSHGPQAQGRLPPLSGI